MILAWEHGIELRLLTFQFFSWNIAVFNMLDTTYMCLFFLLQKWEVEHLPHGSPMDSKPFYALEIVALPTEFLTMRPAPDSLLYSPSQPCGTPTSNMPLDSNIVSFALRKYFVTGLKSVICLTGTSTLSTLSFPQCACKNSSQFWSKTSNKNFEAFYNAAGFDSISLVFLYWVESHSMKFCYSA